jgi:hypothetical protein
VPFFFCGFSALTAATAESWRITSPFAVPSFVQRLAVDAQRCRRACFQALDADFDAALVAESRSRRFRCGQGLVDLLDQLALAIAIAQFDGDIGFLAGAIVGVGKTVASSCMV